MLSASSQCCMLRANIDRNNPTHPPSPNLLHVLRSGDMATVVIKFHFFIKSYTGGAHSAETVFLLHRHFSGFRLWILSLGLLVIYYLTLENVEKSCMPFGRLKPLVLITCLFHVMAKVAPINNSPATWYAAQSTQRKKKSTQRKKSPTLLNQVAYH